MKLNWRILIAVNVIIVENTLTAIDYLSTVTWLVTLSKKLLIQINCNNIDYLVDLRRRSLVLELLNYIGMPAMWGFVNQVSIICGRSLRRPWNAISVVGSFVPTFKISDIASWRQSDTYGGHLRFLYCDCGRKEVWISNDSGAKRFWR